MTTARRMLVGVAVALVGAATLPVQAQSPDPLLQNTEYVTTVPGTTGGHVVARGDRLYVGAYGLGMRIFDISDPAAPKEIGSYIPGFQSTADPGLRADAVPDAAFWDGRHIATLNGTSRASGTQQTEFLDVTDAAEPVLLHRATGSANGEAHNGDIAQKARLWLPSGGGGANGLRIFDMAPLLETPPRPPTRLGGWNPHSLWVSSPYRDGRPAGDGFNHTHDLEIYEDYELLLPEDEWEDQTGDGTPDPTYARRDIVLLAGASGYALAGPGANSSGMYVIDVTDRTNPVVLSKWQNPSGDGHHPIRYLHEVQFVDGDPTTMVVTDEDLHNGCDAGRVYVLKASPDLLTVEKASEWAIGTGTPAGVCGSHVLSSKDGYVYMGAYQAGLQIIDVRDPANPMRVGQALFPGMNSWGALAYRDHVYVGDFGPRGLDVFRFHGAGVAPPRPTAVRPLAVEDAGQSLEVSGRALLGGQEGTRVADDAAGDSLGGAATAAAGLDIDDLAISRNDARTGELVFTYKLTDLPRQTAGPLEAAQYNWDILVDGGSDAGGTNWSLKMMRSSQANSPGSVGTFGGIYQCVTSTSGFTCSIQRRVRATFDFVRKEASIHVPMDAIGAKPGSKIEGWSRVSALGPAWVSPSASGAQTLIAQSYDSVTAVSEYTVPSAGATLGVAPAGTPQGEVSFTAPVTLDPDGSFRASLPRPASGTHDVWVRACVAASCDATFRRIAL